MTSVDDDLEEALRRMESRFDVNLQRPERLDLTDEEAEALLAAHRAKRRAYPSGRPPPFEQMIDEVIEDLAPRHVEVFRGWL